MSELRQSERNTFVLAHCGEQAETILLAADASFRTYYRVHKAEGIQYVLMDAPPDKEDVSPFVNVTQILQQYGLKAPRIFAQDSEFGFLLLEDFGDTRLTHKLIEQPQTEQHYYIQAMEPLICLYQQRERQVHPGVAPYDEAEYMRELSLFTEWWIPHHFSKGNAEAFQEKYDAFWQSALGEISLHQGTLVLRDYHADNLMVTAEDELGLLDYQDALMGDPAYDVVSLLEDARRDVSETTVRQALRHYLQATGQEEQDFMSRYALLGAQRNLKILGIFMRLAKRDHKHHYLAYIPRVWRLLETDLKHPALASLRRLIDECIPAELRDIPSLEKGAA